MIAESTDKTTETLAAYLTNLRDAFVAAHRHKETLAWGIAAFYVVATLQLSSSLNGRHSFLADARESAVRVLLAGLFLVATIAVTTYQRRQFNLRHYYIRLSLVLETLLTDCIAGELDHLSVDGAALRRPCMPAQIGSVYREVGVRNWPMAVWDFVFPSRIRIAGAVETGVSPQMLGAYPAFVVSRAVEQERNNPGDRRIYDLPYLLTLLVGSVGFFKILLMS